MTDRSEETREQTATGGLTPLALLRSAREQLHELTGLYPESLTRMERTDEGWVLDWATRSAVAPGRVTRRTHRRAGP
jgi:hypothetical protein